MQLNSKFILLIIIISFCYITKANNTSDESANGEAIFQKLCTACHTIGKGKLIGPDLDKIIERRDTNWLKGFIQSPSSYISKGDEIAKSLLKEFGVPMPDLGLTPNEVHNVIAFLSAPKKQEKIIVPSQFLPTILIGIAGVFLLTIIGLVAGRKKVEVRL
jgi:cytochrome c2